MHEMMDDFKLQAFFFVCLFVWDTLFLPPRCTDREADWQAGDEASVCARVGPEVF